MIIPTQEPIQKDVGRIPTPYGLIHPSGVYVYEEHVEKFVPQTLQHYR